MFSSCLRAPNSHQLSDEVIGGVVQRSRAFSRGFSHGAVIGGMDHKRSQAAPSSEAVVVGTPPASKRQRIMSPRKFPRSVEDDNRASEYHVKRVVLADRTRATAPQLEKETKRRLTARERNRNKQRRYRQKQCDLIISLEEDTQRLRDEIERLSKRCADIQGAIPTQDTVWKVVAEYFHVFRHGVYQSVEVAPVVAAVAQSPTQLDFLRAAMTSDVTHDAGQGVDTLMDNWIRFCQGFEDVELALQNLQQENEDSLVANVTTSFTITERTMRSVFAHLNSRGNDGNSNQLVQKLLGQRLTMRGRTRFQWDSALGRITGIMSETDMITPMLTLLGNLEDVSSVFEKLPDSNLEAQEYAVALKLKPQLHVRNGCLPYPAVDANGNTNKGLGPQTWAWSPRCDSAIYSAKRSQVYGRMTEYNGTWAIMYSWYFPKDTAWSMLYPGHRHGWENAIVWLDRLSENATISAVSVSGALGAYSTDTPPAPGSSSVKVTYTSSYWKQHYLKTATSPGLFQDLVMWDDMTDAARSALETTEFNNVITTTLSGFSDSASVDVPMIDANFIPNLEKAFPF